MVGGDKQGRVARQGGREEKQIMTHKRFLSSWRENILNLGEEC